MNKPAKVQSKLKAMNENINQFTKRDCFIQIIYVIPLKFVK